jgi:hypothetical protein
MADPQRQPEDSAARICNGGQSPRWKSDGKELFFVSPDAEMMAVDMTLDALSSPNVPHRLFPLKSADPVDLAGYDVRPDGQQFLIFTRQRGTQDARITVVLNWWAELRAGAMIGRTVAC